MGTATAPPAARQGEQTAAQERASKVLLRDRCLSARPPIAELVEVGKDRVPQDALERVGTQEPVEHGMRADVVESIERLAQLLTERSCRRCRASVICSGSGVKSCWVCSCEPSRLGRRHALLEMLEHATDPPLVILAVETESAVGASGRQDPVPTLPRAEHLRRYPDAAAQLPIRTGPRSAFRALMR